MPLARSVSPSSASADLAAAVWYSLAATPVAVAAAIVMRWAMM